MENLEIYLSMGGYGAFIGFIFYSDGCFNGLIIPFPPLP